MRKNYRYLILCTLFCGLLLGYSCSKSSPKNNPTPVTPTTPTTPTNPVSSDMQAWLTTADQSQLFKKQNIALNFNTNTNSNPTIKVDDSQAYQSIDGFGFALTGGSASLINSLSEANKPRRRFRNR